MAMLIVTALILVHFVHAQVNWTPIYVDGKNQVDMWTAKTKGCRCGFDSSRQDCACCVKDGGCQCGADSPNRCGQCGLQDHCTSMCNITLDARILLAKSGKTYGQIKSPSVEGPAFCWYRLLPDSGQRVEIQIYRLVNTGRFNGTGCESGFLQLVDGTESIPRLTETQICGGNDRYSPPVVLFGDKGPASLVFYISEPTVRSQFLAYYSFTAANNTQGVGFHPRGGRRVENTECDWLYQDFSCKEPDSCRLASPGYPGVYSPNRVCKFLITTSSIHTNVKIKFTVMNLPHSQCNTDNVSIYQGSTTTSTLLNTICGNKKQELVFSGPSLLIAFKSGPSSPPYDYNGFLASLEFWDKVPTTTSTEAPAIGVSVKTTEQTIMSDGSQQAGEKPVCQTVFYSNSSKSGHFDSRTLSKDFHPNCSFLFLGDRDEVVHVSLFNYKLKSLSCQSWIESYDGVSTDLKPTSRICSPLTRHARDPTGKFQSQQMFVSTGNSLLLLLRRMPPQSGASEEFLDGAFHFHNEHVQGTLQPDTLCTTDYYGLSSSPRGHVTGPGQEHIFWNVDGRLQCSQRFIPAVNQSVSLQVTMIGLSADTNCHTECGDSSCRCVFTNKQLSEINHLKLEAEGGLVVACLCGDFQQLWLPVGLRSWSPIKLVYNVAHYSWETKGFQYSADYKFITDSYCGHHTTTQHSGFIESGNLTETGQLNHFFHQTCTWLLDAYVERQLTIQFASNQNRPCSAWNLTVHKYAEENSERTGEMLTHFCPRHKVANFSTEYGLNIVVIKLTAMSSIPPEFQIKWRSQVARASTRTVVSVPVTASRATRHLYVTPSVTMATVTLFVLSVTLR
ncbi:uncharacterized protein LOC128996585 [Macrosteles quadrilineatus]|uniref:uncharacterized protein LOC128996585 n=1 Tax=Macrosteles quadrilineatus TaxID=74068 RepID=UPI0023E1609B|nr:uncharacterized protein LOC128996585 [Macrosteles quadrilineatus]